MNAPKKNKSIISRRSSHNRDDDIMEIENEEVVGKEKNNEKRSQRDSAPCLFVMESPESCDEEMKTFHKTLFSVMEGHNVEPCWISRSEVLRVEHSSSDFYVLPQFNGPEYDHLIEKGCKIVGPFVIDRCLKSNRRLPKWKHPIFALSMEGAVVCFTGFSKEKKNKLSELVRRMGGTVTGDLHEKVTVLIAPSCDTDSAKYTESAKLKLPVVREDWINDAWMAVEQRLIDDNVCDQVCIDSYRVPLFTHMVITLSGCNAQEKSHFGGLIEKGKGVFSSEMRKGVCTHLVVSRNSGEKFKKAREWGPSYIRIVTLKWLMKSVECGYVQKESHYDPERIRASTPTKAGGKPLDELDMSIVPHGGPNAPVFNNSTMSITLNTSMNTTTTTTLGTSVVKSSFSRHDSSRRLTLLDTTNDTTVHTDGTDDIDMSVLQGDEDFFEGLRIFLVGVPEVREAWWKRVLIWSGATRANRLEGSTHIVVVGGSVDKSVTSSGRPVLTTEWISACIRAKKMVPHGEYTYGGCSSTTRQSSSSQSIISNVNGPPITSQRVFNTPSTVINKDNRQSRLQSTVTTHNRDGMTPQRPSNGPIQSSHPISTSSSSNQSNRDLLKGITFRVHDVMEGDERKGLEEQIKQSGGSIVNGSNESQYLLCPLIDFGPILPPSEYGSKDCVTTFWMERIHDECHLLSPSSHPLFRPIPAVKSSNLFNNLIIYLHSFENESEKFAYSELLKFFGATIRENIDRVSISRLTHIICGGSITNLIRSSSVRIVDPSWIIECIIHDKVLIEEDYPFNERPYKTYEGRKDDLWEWEKCEERREKSRSRNDPSIRSLEMAKEGMDDDMDILDMGAFDEGGMNDNMEEEEDSMIREIVQEANDKDQSIMSIDEPVVNESKIRRNSTTVPMSHPRLQMLRTQNIPSSPHGPLIGSSSPSQFLHPNAHPKVVLNAGDELLDSISSPLHSEMDRSNDELSTSRIGHLLEYAVERTGRMCIETPPARGNSTTFHYNDTNTTPPRSRGLSTRSTVMTSSPILNRSRFEPITTSDRGSTISTTIDDSEKDDDSPQDSMIVLSPDVVRIRKEMTDRMNAALEAKRIEDNRRISEEASTSTTGTKDVMNKDKDVGVTRTRRKRLRELTSAFDTANQETAVKRVPLISPSTTDKPHISPIKVGWEDGPINRDLIDDAFADHSRILDSPVRVHPTTESSMPSTSRPSTSMNDMNRSRRGDGRPIITPAKTLNPRRTIGGNDKTQGIDRSIHTENMKSTKKNKSTTAVSRRIKGGKENDLKQKTFAFTALESEEKVHLSDIVRSLGGNVSTSSDFDRNVTHIVSGKLVRNERILSAIASGQFILQSSFVLDSQRDGRWKNEEDYDWSRSDVIEKISDEKDRRMAQSINRWRQTVMEQRASILIDGDNGDNRIGAFVGWRVCLYSGSRTKSDGMVRLVRAGGGEAVLRDDIDTQQLKELRPTHVLVDSKPSMWNIEELRLIHSLSSRAFPIDFLYKYLISDRFDERTAYLPEYTKILNGP